MAIYVKVKYQQAPEQFEEGRSVTLKAEANAPSMLVVKNEAGLAIGGVMAEHVLSWSDQMPQPSPALVPGSVLSPETTRTVESILKRIESKEDRRT